MRSRARKRTLLAVPLAVTAAAVAVAVAPPFGGASSHREAPSISQDPTADNTDVYAFRSPDAPDTATLVANFVPFEEPAGGPNFYRFSDDVKYEIKVDNTGDGNEDVTYELRFDTQTKNPSTFLYNTDKITFDAKKGRVHQPQPGPDLHGPQDHQGLEGPDLREDPRPGPSHPAEQRRPALDSQLRVARVPGDLLRQGRDQGLRRPARRPVLRGPGRHVRPDRLPQRAPRRVQHGRRRRPQGLQRQHDRHPGADHSADRDQEDADRRQQHRLGRRRLRDGLSAGHHQGRRHEVAAGLPPRRAAHQRGRHPAREEGPLEPQRPGR